MTGTDFVDRLAQEIRRVDGENKLGAGALAEAISSFMQGESLRLFNLLHDIRKAAGDPEGKLMQDELVARIADMAYRLQTATQYGEQCDADMRQLLDRNDSALHVAKTLRETIGNEYMEATARRRLLVVADELEQALGKGSANG